MQQEGIHRCNKGFVQGWEVSWLFTDGSMRWGRPASHLTTLNQQPQLLTLVFCNGRQWFGSKARPMSCRFLAMDFLLSHAFLICGLRSWIRHNKLKRKTDQVSAGGLTTLHTRGYFWKRGTGGFNILTLKLMTHKHVESETLLVSQLSWVWTLQTADVASHAPAGYHANGTLALTSLSSGYISSSTSSSASSGPVHS